MANLVRARSWGTVKPPPGAQIDWGHPLAQGLVVCFPLNDGLNPRDLVAGRRLTPATSTSVAAVGKNGTGLRTSTISDGWTIPTGVDPFPTASCTVAIAIAKNDATLRNSSAFGYNVGGAQPGAISLYAPFGDGVVYWYFGGTGGNNAVTASGLTIGNDLWVTRAGRRGTAIYQNGSLRASKTVAITRTKNTTDAWYLSNGAGGSTTQSDFVTFGFFNVWDRELGDDQIAWLNAEPYAFIAPPGPKILYFPMGAGGGTTTTAVATTFNTHLVLGRRSAFGHRQPSIRIPVGVDS